METEPNEFHLIDYLEILLTVSVFKKYDNVVRQQILKNQEIVEELRAIWDKGTDGGIADEVAGVMEKYFGKRHLQ